MRIHFDSGGGVTGAAGRRQCALDTDTLPSAVAAEVLALVQAANLPALAGRVSRVQGRPRPDEMYYEITIEDSGRVQSVSASDRDMPVGLRPLFNWLSRWAIGGK